MSKRRLFGAQLITMAALLTLGGCTFDIDPPKSESEKIMGPAAVLFNVEGPMPQFTNSTGIFPSMAVSQYRLETLLAKAASDLQVQEVVVHFGNTALSFARAGELTQAIRRVAVQGKPVTCHIDEADNVTYWMAAGACPRILISPAGGIDAIGLSLEAIYMRELLSSIGVTADMLSIGKYKDAAEPFTRDNMSPDAREAAQSLLFELHRIFKEGLAARQKIASDAVQALIDGGPFSADESVKLGLADGISTLGAYLDSIRANYAAGVIDDYGKTPEKPFSITEFFKLISGSKKEASIHLHPRVALVPVIGPITSGTSDELLGGMDIVHDTVLVDALYELGRDNTVKSVVLRIDSPGGSALASDNIWHAVRALAAKKPVVASMGDVAASGGYYIASASTETLASPSTITGSIGVVGGKIVVKEAAAKLGIKTERIDTGKLASLNSPFSPFDEDGRRSIKRVMQKAYDLFVDRVAEGRKLDRNQVLKVSEGRVWTGSQAIQLGLVDRSGGLSEAIDRARELAKLPAGTPVDIFPEPKNLIETLGEALSGPDVTVTAAIARRYRAVRHGFALTGLLLDQKVLTFLPTFFEIR
ncbi:MAG: signal peptide peptidase SppA [Proteobacteria bacterium]|nr:signal peptide peptidase SppA [Pseudomonadota bacterium]